MRGRLVPENPVLTPGLLRLAAAPPVPLPPETVAWHAFDYGRGALRHGALLLGLQPGDSVLMPSLVCDVVPAVFRDLGIAVRYYPVGDALEADFRKAAVLVDATTKAFVGIHFFGLPQPVEPMRRFCDERGLAFVEDNAHGLLSEAGGMPLGGSGEIAIVSIRKVLPIPTGGALLVNSRSVADSVGGPSPDARRAALRMLLRYATRTMLRNVELAAGVPLVGRAKAALRGGDATDGSGALAPATLGGWWRVSRWLAWHIDSETIRQARRLRFDRWLERVVADDGAPRPVFTELPDGAVPLGLPIEVDTPRAARWVAAMRARGVEISPWPDLPPDSPEARWRDRLFLLPLTADVEVGP